jgi:hypothetical protein
MTCIYAHPPQDSILDERRFTLSEGLLEYQGRKVLYHYSEAVGVTFCTGTGAPFTGNINVRGYVVRWKYGANDNGEDLSEIEPITDQKEQKEISRLLWPSPNDFSRVNFQ